MRLSHRRPSVPTVPANGHHYVRPVRLRRVLLASAGAELAAAFWWLAFLVALGRIGLGVVILLQPRGHERAAEGTRASWIRALNFIRMTGAAIGVNALAILIDDRIASPPDPVRNTGAE